MSMLTMEDLKTVVEVDKSKRFFIIKNPQTEEPHSLLPIGSTQVKKQGKDISFICGGEPSVKQSFFSEESATRAIKLIISMLENESKSN